MSIPQLVSSTHLHLARNAVFPSFRRLAATASIATLGWVAAANATVISFDDGAVVAGSTLGTQYASKGVVFAPGGGLYTGVVNPPSTSVGFATNTDLTISALDSSVGEGAPLSGLVLRSDANFGNENGDPVFTMTFNAPVTSLSVDFGDVKNAFQGSPALFAVETTGEAVSIALAPNAKNGTSTAVGLPAGVTTIVVVPGTHNDFVAVDNITYTLSAVPEPSTVAASLAGFGLLMVVLRLRQRTKA